MRIFVLYVCIVELLLKNLGESLDRTGSFKRNPGTLGIKIAHIRLKRLN